MLKFGLKQKQVLILKQIFVNYKNISKVVIFGSRVKNTYKAYSDIDLCLFGNIEEAELIKIQNEITESNLLYKVDLVVFINIVNKKLKQNILTEGEVFWEV